jgi:hypothetical protein
MEDKINYGHVGKAVTFRDTTLLPDHYTPVDEPYYQGDGVHSVYQLQEVCKAFSEYCHQQQIIKQELLKLAFSQQDDDLKKRVEELESCLRDAGEDLRGWYGSNKYAASDIRDRIQSLLTNKI